MATPREPGLKGSPRSHPGSNLDSGAPSDGRENEERAREGRSRKAADNALDRTPVEKRRNPAEAHPTKTGEQSDKRSSGEEAARREQVQQDDGPKPSGRDQNRTAQRDQDDGGQSGQVGRDQNSR